MSLILGVLYKNRISRFDSYFNGIYKYLYSSKFEYTPFKYKNLKGGIFLHKNYPYSSSNFIFYTDKIFTVIVGQVYNQNEILKKLDAALNKVPLAKLIYLSYQKWGTSFINKINGDYSILIYDYALEHLFIVRDKLGIIPMAYSTKNQNHYFCSDAISLCKLLYAKNDTFNKDYCIKWLGLPNGLYSCLPSEKVFKIKPGHYLKIENDYCRQYKYWYPENIKIDHKLSFNTIKTELKKIIADSVAIRSDSKFMASAHLSGGLDSSTVATFARKEYVHQDNFYGFSWAPEKENAEDLKIDERHLVQDVCSIADITPIYYSYPYKSYKEYDEDGRICSHMFEEVSTRNEAEKLGINLIFSGWGGDEFVSINSRGIDSDLLFNFQWGALLKKNRTKNPFRLARLILNNILIPAFYKKIYSNDDGYDILKYFNLSTREKKILKNNSFSYRSRQEVHIKLLNEFHIAERAEDWTLNGGRKGIEYRYPLLDFRIIEYMLKIPSKLLFKNGFTRIILREIGEGIIPESVRWHNSKFDEVKYKADKSVLNAFFQQVIDDLDELKSNPILDFIKFEQLTRDTQTKINDDKENYVSQHVYLMLSIHKLHNFIKLYQKV